MRNLRLLQLLFISLLFVFASCSEESDDDPAPTSANNSNNNNQNQNAKLPGTIQGSTANMIFTAPQAGAPYALDQEVNFTFSSSGEMTIDDDPAANDGAEVSIMSFTTSGSEYIWSDAQSGFDYTLSLKSDSSINEINVSKAGTFLGQFIEISSGNNANLVGNYAGTYAVTTVTKGSHSRMSVSIDSLGNIDFDTNVQLNSADYAEVYDRIDCCDGIWIDMNPYPTEPYPRVNLFIDSNTNVPSRLEYMPEYPGIGNRVHVEF